MPQELKDILLLGIFNPAMLLAGYWLGRRIDQRQKILLAGFAAGIAGAVFAWVLMRLGLTEAKPRLLSGILIVALLAGMAAAWAGYEVGARGGAKDP